jgi:hypothetical protein
MTNTTFFDLSDLGLPTSTNAYLQQFLTAVQTQWPNYTPNQGNLEYLLAQIIASWAADSASLASFGSADLFQTFGTKLINLPPLAGQAAAALLNINTSSISGMPIAVLSSGLSTGSAIVSLPVNSLVYAIPAGTITLTDPTGGNTQTWTTTGAGVGATSIAVSSQTPNFAYPTGSNITGSVDYTLTNGTQFDLDDYGFQTITDTTIVAGDSATVLVYAVEVGSDYNNAGAGGSVSIISQINWVTEVTLASGAASGGIDPEDPTAYLNRLAATLQTMAQRPITASDYATMALNFQPAQGTDQQEVGRAAAIDGAQLSSPVERSVTLYVTDTNGNPLNSDTLTALEAYFTALREVNFIVTVQNPSYQPVYVTVEVAPTAGYDAATVATNVQNAIINWLSPANWGTAPPYGISGTWATTAVTIYRSQLEGIIQNVNGVDHIITGTLAFGGTASPTNTTTDYTLSGTATLPVANTATVPIAGGTTSSALSTGGGAITSIAVNALAFPIPAGSLVLVDPTGAHTQTWTTTGAAASATSVTVSSATPNFNYPAGSSFSGPGIWVN